MAPLGKKERTRVIAFEVYPESTNIDWLDRLIDSAHVEAARSPIHDQDEYDRTGVEDWQERHGLLGGETGNPPLRDVRKLDDAAFAALCDSLRKQPGAKGMPSVGDKKKAHYHYVMAFAGMKSYEQIVELIGGAATYIEKVESKSGYLKYLCHIGRPDKAQYSIDLVRPFGGMNLDVLTHIDEFEMMDYTDLVVDYIVRNRCNSLNRLVAWAKQSENFQIKSTVYKKTPFFIALMSSLGNDRAQAKRALGSTPDRMRDFEAGMFQEVG